MNTVPFVQYVQSPSLILPRDAGEERGGGWNGWNEAKRLNGWNDWIETLRRHADG
jgi:hypothetical protein